MTIVEALTQMEFFVNDLIGCYINAQEHNKGHNRVEIKRSSGLLLHHLGRLLRIVEKNNEILSGFYFN
jgi:hypothetical protein